MKIIIIILLQIPVNETNEVEIDYNIVELYVKKVFII